MSQMTKEQRAALKFAITAALAAADYLPGTLADKADRIGNDIADGVAALIAEAVAAEREACFDVANAETANHVGSDFPEAWKAASGIAADIRARGNR